MAKVKKSSSPKSSSSSSGGDNSVACAVLSYFLVGIIWYFVDEGMKKSSLAKFHAKQGLALLIAWVVVWVVGMLVFWIPVIGWLLGVVVTILFLVLWIVGIINAAGSKQKPLPLIGWLGEKFSF